MIMEIEKLHDLMSASWGTRRSSDRMWSESSGLSTNGADGITSSSAQRPQS